MTPARWIAFALLLAALAAAAFGIFGAQRAARQADELFARARAQLAAGDAQSAAATARLLLEREPGHGRAFGLLTRALQDEGSEEEILARYQVAARRAPRDAHVRGWLATHHLERGEYAEAIVQIDALMTVAPGNRRELLQMLAQLSADQGFASALAAHLADRPHWRGAVLRSASAARDKPEAIDNLHGALRRNGDLSPQEVARWIDGLLAGGRWGAAYAHWVSGLDPLPERLPVPWNGDFSRAPSSTGFDWRVRRTRGVSFSRVPVATGGHAARLEFLGREVGHTGVEVPLLLAPGRHRLRLEVLTEGLRSEQGLAWRLTCSGGRPIGDGLRLRDARTWTPLEHEFEVPAEGCEGQWLRLVNPAPRGFAQSIRGALQFTGVTIERLP